MGVKEATLKRGDKSCVATRMEKEKSEPISGEKTYAFKKDAGTREKRDQAKRARNRGGQGTEEQRKGSMSMLRL